jgi:hypothetical protein
MKKDTHGKEKFLRSLLLYILLIFPCFVICSIIWYFFVDGVLYYCSDKVPFFDLLPPFIHGKNFGDYFIVSPQIVYIFWIISLIVIFLLPWVITRWSFIRNVRIIKFVVITIVFLVFCFIIYSDNINGNGKIYSSKEKLCGQFAQSYLRTVPITDNARSSEDTISSENQRWQMAIDVETDFYNLCMLNLEENSLKMYKSVVIDKYQRQ